LNQVLHETHFQIRVPRLCCDVQTRTAGCHELNTPQETLDNRGQGQTGDYHPLLLLFLIKSRLYALLMQLFCCHSSDYQLSALCQKRNFLTMG